ncbi:MAG: hypothetical protein EXR68_03500 [Dehalococcoidia bacterium]|nr:hypothetical protein [Dehalococcoidia bacterium]
MEHTITYHGRLTDNGQPATGSYDIQFRLFSVVSGGAVITTVDHDNVQVSQGLFSTELDFGDSWDGSKKWVELAIRPGSSTGSYTTLGPRQAVNGSPFAYALHLPFAGSGSWTIGANTALYEVTLNGFGTAIRGKSSSASSIAIEGDGGASGTGGKFKGAVAIAATGPVNVTGIVTVTGIVSAAVVSAAALVAETPYLAGTVSTMCTPTGEPNDSGMSIPAAEESDDIVIITPVAVGVLVDTAFVLKYNVGGCTANVWTVIGFAALTGRSFNYLIIESDY